MRALGDAAFTLALTPENYSEARRCYEEAIALDEGLRESLQDKLRSLDNLEKKHRAQALEDQADLALANCRFREACELYNKALKFVLTGSEWYKCIYEKFNAVNKIIGTSLCVIRPIT
jgi:tetratricopeptide (TPR) repeat protein